jgi:hypothetical protein
MSDTKNAFSILITALIKTLPGYVMLDDFHSDSSVQKRGEFKEG